MCHMTVLHVPYDCLTCALTVLNMPYLIRVEAVDDEADEEVHHEEHPDHQVRHHEERVVGRVLQALFPRPTTRRQQAFI